MLAAYSERDSSSRNALKEAEKTHRACVKKMKADSKKRQKNMKALRGVSIDDVLAAAAAKAKAGGSSSVLNPGSGS